MSEQTHRPMAADDFVEIRKHLERVKERPWVEQAAPVSQEAEATLQMPQGTKCALQDSRYGDVLSCSCQRKGPNGTTAACPPRPGAPDGSPAAWAENFIWEHRKWTERVRREERAKDGGDWEIYARNHPID